MQGVEIPEETKRAASAPASAHTPAPAPAPAPVPASAAEINRPPSRSRRGPGQLQL